jgi:hypothetical protein
MIMKTSTYEILQSGPCKMDAPVEFVFYKLYLGRPFNCRIRLE